MLQCIAKTEGGKRTVAGVHWDYDCYGAHDSLSCHGSMLQVVAAFSQCACSGKTVRSHQAEVSKRKRSLCGYMLYCHSVAGGTQKLLLGEPTMMPNWDRDAEVCQFASLAMPRMMSGQHAALSAQTGLHTARGAGHVARATAAAVAGARCAHDMGFDAKVSTLASHIPQAGRALLRRSELEIFECPLHLEGGSIHTDGEG